MDADILVVGAGIAGLACARRLQRAGRSAVLLDKGRGLGGRCATRRILNGQPVDHGVAFLHGGDPAFLAALDEVEAPRVEGWPFHVEGRGVPCQPDTYTARDRRMAFVDGVSVFPKHLAKGLQVVTDAKVTVVEPQRVWLDDGRTFSASQIILTPPVEQLAALLPSIPETAAIRTMLGWVGTFPCLTVIAAYDLAVPGPQFDVFYPEEGPLQVVLHDSAKRQNPRHRVLVLQAGTRSSRASLDVSPDVSPEIWQAELLVEAGRLLGETFAHPVWSTAHRWRYARIAGGSGFGGPVHFPVAGGFLGIAGEAFSPVGGVQGAFLSGDRLARRILGEAS